MRAPHMAPPAYWMERNFPKRDELSLRDVFALPKASRNGLQSSTFLSIDTFSWIDATMRSRFFDTLSTKRCERTARKRMTCLHASVFPAPDSPETISD